MPSPAPTSCNFTIEPILPFLPKDCDRTKYSLDLVIILIYKAVTILSWAASVAAIFLLVYAGFLYITAAGEEGKVSTAKKIISAVVIGIVIIMLARWSLHYVVLKIADTGTAENIYNEINQIPQ